MNFKRNILAIDEILSFSLNLVGKDWTKDFRIIYRLSLERETSYSKILSLRKKNSNHVDF